MSLYDVYAQYPIELEAASGMELTTTQGEKYLDFYGGHAVISIGHSHPHYLAALTEQLGKIGFYSNVVQNRYQQELSDRLNGYLTGEYALFLCNSGAEANENALKLASFKTGRKKVLAFKGSFHGRTSAAVAATDNPSIVAPVNAGHEVSFVAFGDYDSLKKHLYTAEYCAVIIETIQGVGGLDQPSIEFASQINTLCKETGTLLIADEVQSGFGRSGKFFSFQRFDLEPDFIPVAKGMGNGFPIGGVLIHEKHHAVKGELGTTFGGNYLACRAALAVLDVIEKEGLVENASLLEQHFRAEVERLGIDAQIKGAGLMIGLDFGIPTAPLRKALLEQSHVFVGSSSNPNVVRILPPLNCTKEALSYLLSEIKRLS